MRIAYESKRFASETLDAIHQANLILNEYAEQGYDLTLRQLFYQHVARGLIPNTERSYKRLGSIVNDARLAGYIDWDSIIDRTRNVREVTHWRDPEHIINGAARSFRRALWEAQGDYVEVWIEKDALVGVIAGICSELDVPYFSCRGYTSQSEMWAASQRLLEPVKQGKHVTVLHLGDHDPSGIDMTRDIQDRLRTFIWQDFARWEFERDGIDIETASDVSVQASMSIAADRLTIKRIALTMDQIRQYDPPPNPAKLSDSRAGGYVVEYGYESWELDSLEPAVLTELVRSNVTDLIDADAWDEVLAEEDDAKRLLAQASERWTEIVESLNGDEPDE